MTYLFLRWLVTVNNLLVKLWSCSDVGEVMVGGDNSFRAKSTLGSRPEIIFAPDTGSRN